MEILPGFKTCRKGLHQYTKELSRCPDCHKEARKRWQQNNLDKKNLANSQWSAKNKKKQAEQIKRWHEKNPDKRKEYCKRWNDKNVEKRKQWQKTNVNKIKSYSARRRALKQQAIASWANFKEIEKIYEACPSGFHVDHIYPINSDYMCGLHVETNLQILTAEENFKKSNRVWPGQLDCQKGSVYDIFSKELTDLLNDQEN